MRKGARRATAPEKRATSGKHGGNRAGDRNLKNRAPRRSSQAAGKDQKRGSER